MDDTTKIVLITLAAIVGLFLLGGLIALIAFYAQQLSSRNALQTALATQSDLLTQQPVDLARYSGRWFEQARLPVWFEDEKKCRCVTAEYKLNPTAGTVDVLNTCWNPDGTVHKSARGVARPANENNTALRVSFGPAFLGDAIAGNYWIFHLDSDYQNAIVGSPDFRTMWILTRSSEPLPRDQLQQLVSIAQQKGFDTEKLILRPNECHL